MEGTFAVRSLLLYSITYKCVLQHCRKILLWRTDQLFFCLITTGSYNDVTSCCTPPPPPEVALQSNTDLRPLKGLLPICFVFDLSFQVVIFVFINICLYTAPPSVFIVLLVDLLEDYF
jgi:hypothetical protein